MPSRCAQRTSYEDVENVALSSVRRPNMKLQETAVCIGQFSPRNMLGTEQANNLAHLQTISFELFRIRTSLENLYERACQNCAWFSEISYHTRKPDFNSIIFPISPFVFAPFTVWSPGQAHGWPAPLSCPVQLWGILRKNPRQRFGRI
jgi:hypothetical protein